MDVHIGKQRGIAKALHEQCHYYLLSSSTSNCVFVQSNIVLDVPGSWHSLHLGDPPSQGGLVRLNQAALTLHLIAPLLSRSLFCSLASNSPFFISQSHILHCDGFSTRFRYLDSSLDAWQKLEVCTITPGRRGSGSLQTHRGSPFGSRPSSFMGDRVSHHSKAGALYVMTIDPDLPRWPTRALERPKWEPPSLDYRECEEGRRMYDSINHHPDTKQEE